MVLREFDENIITIYVEYNWKNPYKRSNEDGIATLEWTGSSYKVLKFKTIGMTYKAK